MEDQNKILDEEMNFNQLPKARHGCVTAWLVFMIVANSATALMYLFAQGMMAKSGLAISPAMYVVLAVLAIINIYFAVMLLKWKKMAFYGFVGTSVVAVILNVSMGLGIMQSLMGLIGVAILFAILQIKENNVSAWENME